MEQNPTYEKIEAYLDHSLSASEHRAFEQEIAQNPDLATQVELQRFERDGMEMILENDLRNDMVTWKKEMLQSYADQNQNRGRVVQIRRRRYLAIAASFLIVVSAAALIWLKPFNTDPSQDLAVNTPKPNTENINPTVSPNNSEPDPEEKQPIAQLTDPQTKGDTPPPEEQVEEIDEVPQTLTPEIQTAPQVATQNNNLELAIQNFNSAYLQGQQANENAQLDELINAFSNGEYEKVLPLALTFKDPYPLGQEFLAGSFFQLKQFDKAQAIYNNLMRLSITDKGLRERTEWNLLLTYLAQDQTNYVDFNRLMNRITGDPQHEFFDEADALKGVLGY